MSMKPKNQPPNIREDASALGKDLSNLARDMQNPQDQPTSGILHQVKSSAIQLKDSVTQGLNTAAEMCVDGINTTKNNIADFSSNVAHKTKDAAIMAKDKTVHGAVLVKDKTVEGVSTATSKVKGAALKAKHGTANAANTTLNRFLGFTKSWQNKISTQVEGFMDALKSNETPHSVEKYPEDQSAKGMPQLSPQPSPQPSGSPVATKVTQKKEFPELKEPPAHKQPSGEEQKLTFDLSPGGKSFKQPMKGSEGAAPSNINAPLLGGNRPSSLQDPKTFAAAH